MADDCFVRRRQALANKTSGTPTGKGNEEITAPQPELRLQPGDAMRRGHGGHGAGLTAPEGGLRVEVLRQSQCERQQHAR